jgi:hypothetical protein
MKPLVTTLILGLGLISCNRHKDEKAPEKNSAAFKAGEAAHEMAKESRKAVAAAGRELKKDAKEAREGWKESAREDREKNKKK